MANRSNRCKTRLMIRCLWLAVICTCPLMASAQDVSATDEDSLQNDADGDANVDRGDTIRHEITITNDAGAASDAENVQYDNTPDADTTLVTGSVRISPIAYDDSYDSVGNATLSVDAGSGLLANDVDPVEGGAAPQDATAAGVTVTAETVTTSEGGSATISADGSFNYTPPSGDTGITDTFNYTITDSDGMTDTAIASVTLSNLVWFIDDSAGSGGDGTQSNPFDDFTEVNGAGGTGDVDSAGDTLFIHAGNYSGSLELEGNQTLGGEGQALTIGGNTLVSAGSAPTLANGGDVVILAAGNTIQGLNINATAGAALAGNGSSDTTASAGITTSAGGSAVSLINATGTFTLNGSITGSGTGDGYAVDGGDPAINHTGAIAMAEGQAIAISNTTGGGATFNGGINATSPSVATIAVQDNSGGNGYQFGGLTVAGSTADAVVLSNNPGATYTFGGDFNVTTSSGAGLVADTGTIALADAVTFNNSIDATGGAAVSLRNVDVGTMAWDSLASTGSAGAGINLDTATGSFTVNATTTTIDNPAGAGININGGSADVTISSAGTVNIDNRNAEGIMVGSTGGNVTFGDVNINALNSGTGTGLSVDSTTGTVTFGDITITDSGGDGLTINATAGVDFTGTTIGSGGNVAGVGVNITGANSNTIDLGGGSIANTGGAALRADSGTADINYTGASITTGAGVPAIDLDDGSGTVTISGTLNQSSGGSAVTVDGGSRNVDLSGLTVTNDLTDGSNVIAINNTTGGAVNFGTVDITGAANADAVTVSSHGGSLSFADLDVAANSGEAFNADSPGTLTVTTGTIDATGTLGLDINNAAAGSSVTFSSVTVDSSSDGGVDLTGNDGSITLNDLSITNSNSIGFNASNNSGTLIIADADNDNAISTTTGTALDVFDTTIGTGGLSFRNISASNATRGIRLNNTGTIAGLTVTGDGVTAGSGGTITDGTGNTMENGILVSNAQDISLNYMNLTDANAVDGGGASACDDSTFSGCNGAIELNAATNVSLADINLNGAVEHGIFGSTVTNLDLSNIIVDGAGDEQYEHGMLLVDLLGTAFNGTDNNFDNITIQNSSHNNISVYNTTATDAGNSSNPDLLTVSDSIIQDVGATFGSNGILATSNTGSNLRIEVSNSEFYDNGVGFTFNGEGGDIQADVTGNTFDINDGDQPHGVSISANGASNGTFNITNNPVIRSHFSGGGPAAVVIVGSGSGMLSGTIAGNPDIGSTTDNVIGIRVVSESTTPGATVVVDIDNNTINSDVGTDDFNDGIQLAAREASALDATVQNNTVSVVNGEEPGAISLYAGNGTNQTNNRLCVNLAGNTADASGGSIDNHDYYAEQYDGSNLFLQGFTGDGTDAPTVESFMADTDTSSSANATFANYDANFTTDVASDTCATP